MERGVVWVLHKKKCVGEEIFARGEEEIVAVDREGYRTFGIALGAEIEGIVTGFAELEFALELQEGRLFGGAGGHTGDVEELEFADVIPSEEGLVAGDLLEEVEVGWKSGGGGELVLGLVETGEETRAGEGSIVVAGEPVALLGGCGPGLEECSEIG